jgi:hypothetical protein
MYRVLLPTDHGSGRHLLLLLDLNHTANIILYTLTVCAIKGLRLRRYVRR